MSRYAGWDSGAEELLCDQVGDGGSVGRPRDLHRPRAVWRLFQHFLRRPLPCHGLALMLSSAMHVLPEL